MTSTMSTSGCQAPALSLFSHQKVDHGVVSGEGALRQAVACLQAISDAATTPRLALVTARAANDLQMRHHIEAQRDHSPESGHDPHISAVAMCCLRLWRESGFHPPGAHLQDALKDCDAFALSLTLIHRALTNPDERRVLMRAQRSVPASIIIALGAVEQVERDQSRRIQARCQDTNASYTFVLRPR